MPITGPIPAHALGVARRAAKQAVRLRWQAWAKGINRPLTAGELEQMEQEVEDADSAAILLFLEGNMIVTTPPGGGIGVIT